MNKTRTLETLVNHMPDLLVLAADIVAIAILILAVYYPRHRRRDMLLAFIGLNVGVLAVSTVLAHVSVGVGVGLGLFGVLSIIRLRSSEISQDEVAYFFASLALGLINGLQPDPQWLAPALSLLIVGVIFIVDQPRFHATYRTQLVTLDAVYPNEPALVARLEELLSAKIERAIVKETDLVRDMTVVEVRYTTRPVSSLVLPTTTTSNAASPTTATPKTVTQQSSPGEAFFAPTQTRVEGGSTFAKATR